MAVPQPGSKIRISLFSFFENEAISLAMTVGVKNCPLSFLCNALTVLV